MHDKMVDIVVDYELDLALTLSVVTIDYNQYSEWNKTLPFYKNIERRIQVYYLFRPTMECGRFFNYFQSV